MTEKVKRQKAGDEHYVNNREFTLALDTYSRECKQAEKDGVANVHGIFYGHKKSVRTITTMLTERVRSFRFRSRMRVEL